METEEVAMTVIRLANGRLILVEQPGPSANAMHMQVAVAAVYGIESDFSEAFNFLLRLRLFNH